MAMRWGLTYPLQGIPLSQHESILREAEDLGYTDAWSAVRVLVFGEHLEGCLKRRRVGSYVLRGLRPLFLEVRGAALDAALDLARGAFHLVFHLLQILQFDRAVDLGLDIGHIALGLAEHGADHARHAWQLLRPDDDQRDCANQRQLGNAEIDHGIGVNQASIARNSRKPAPC